MLENVESPDFKLHITGRLKAHVLQRLTLLAHVLLRLTLLSALRRCFIYVLAIFL